MSYLQQPQRQTAPKESRHHAICSECDQLVIVYWGGYPPDWRYLMHLLGPQDGYCVKSKECVSDEKD